MKEIVLTKGFIALVDDEDYEYLSQFSWHAKLCRGRPYAARSAYVPEAWVEKRSSTVRTVLMHREIASRAGLSDVDHQNRNTLDNQRDNLRACSRSQNCANQKIRTTNRSGFKGVNWKAEAKLWCARISVSCKRIHLGYFISVEEAAQAYDAAAVKYFGEFALLNFPIQKEKVGYV